jgi:hypothetical protein
MTIEHRPFLCKRDGQWLMWCDCAPEPTTAVTLSQAQRHAREHLDSIRRKFRWR